MRKQNAIRCISATIVFLLTSYVAKSDVAISPPNNSWAPNKTDLAGFFNDPKSWSSASKKLNGFGVDINYFMFSEPDISRHLIRQISASGIKLGVGLPGIQVDKHKCGDGVEGMVWPGEILEEIERLKILGADVDTFSFDLPLTNATIFQDPRACHFDIRETARRLFETVGIIRSYYPKAKFFDTEVPTGIPVAQWSKILSQWLATYKNLANKQLDGFTMDVWYQGSWQDSVMTTYRVLARYHITPAVILDASGGAKLSAHEWINQTKTIACAYETRHIPIKNYVVANWFDPNVPNLPDSDPDSLTGLITWMAKHGRC